MRSNGGIHDDDVVIEGNPIGGLLHLNIYADGHRIFERVTKP